VVTRPLRTLAAASALALAGCGVGTQSSATLTPPDDVPFGLAEARPETTTTMPPSARATSTSIYLLDRDSRVVPVDRELRSNDVHEVIDALLAGPLPDEVRLGLTSALPDADIVGAVDVTGGIGSVDLDPSFTDLTADIQRSALAQLVFTLTAQPGIGQVSFTLDGQPVEIPRGDGTLASGSVSRDSYRELQP
jgi:spore germination protein GerM